MVRSGPTTLMDEDAKPCKKEAKAKIKIDPLTNLYNIMEIKAIVIMPAHVFIIPILSLEIPMRTDPIADPIMDKERAFPIIVMSNPIAMPKLVACC